MKNAIIVASFVYHAESRRATAAEDPPAAAIAPTAITPAFHRTIRL
jgi:hypothetical protein